MSDAASDRDPDNNKGELSKVPPLSAAALVLAVLALMCSSFAMGWSHPPRVFSSWIVVGVFALLAIPLALWSSRVSTQRYRLVPVAALVVSLFSLGVPVLYYFKSFNDLPWALLVPLLLLLFIGGWICRQRWLSVGCAVIVMFFVATSREASQAELPKSLSTNGLTVTVESNTQGRMTFLVRSTLGTRVEEEIDLKNIRLDGKVFRILPVSTWRPRAWFAEEDRLQPNEALLFAHTFPPGWSRTMDLGVWLPLWPTEPAASVTVPMPIPGEKSTDHLYEAAENGVRLSVGPVQWPESRTRTPSEAVVTMVVSYEGPQFTGWTSKELRVRDQNGRIADLRAGGSSGVGDGVAMMCEVFDIDPGATDLTVDLFTSEQREQASAYLRFGRLPVKLTLAELELGHGEQ